MSALLLQAHFHCDEIPKDFIYKSIAHKYPDVNLLEQRDEELL